MWDNILVPNVLSRTYGYDKSHNIIISPKRLTHWHHERLEQHDFYNRANRLFSEAVTGSNSIRFDYGLDQSIASIIKDRQSRSLSIDPVKRRPTVSGNASDDSFESNFKS